MNSNEKYADKTYWEQRYDSEESYEWFKSLSFFKAALIPHLKPTDSILILGCGNSPFGSDLYDLGFKNSTSIDYCENVINAMKMKNSNRPEMKFLVADITNMSEIQSKSFDVAIDKGTMDALMCEKGDVWDPPLSIKKIVDSELRHVSRIISRLFIYITFGQPHFRRPLLEKDEYNWKVSHSAVGDSFHYFVYVCNKNNEAFEDVQE